jgi:hippurate hydrolase
MNLIDDLVAAHDELTRWRHDFHAHPETAFEETRTAAMVADRLTSFGIEVHRGLARTGVVGVIEGRREGISIALRADLDALHVPEANDFDHRSTHEGKMHACGHDGHTTMLLAAARHLAATRDFAGTVVVVFQPAEENEAGGRVMVQEGLFERFPVRAVFGMHNWPGIAIGSLAMRTGPMMAASDTFEIVIEGQGSHGAMPHLGVDCMLVASHLVTALQSIASRTIDPVQPCVVSVTCVHGGDATNVIPAVVTLKGTARSFGGATQDRIEARIRQLSEGIAGAFGARASVSYDRKYPPLVNTDTETALAARAAVATVGAEHVLEGIEPSLGAEDFAYMLQQRPGCYVWIGNGPVDEGRKLHSPHYDFNDSILPIGASYWVHLVREVLGASSAPAEDA